MAQKLTAATRTDLQQLHRVLKRDWPRTKEVRPYWNHMNEISCYEGLMFNGICIIIPCIHRPVILQHIHAAHLDNEKCRAWATTAVFWPALNAAIDDLVSQCSTCQQHQRSNQRETLIPQQVSQRPWCNVATAPNSKPQRNHFLDDVSVSIDPSVPTVLSGDFNTVFNRSLSRRESDPFDVPRESFCALNRLLNACSSIWRYLEVSPS